jgi:hypothetical protein
MQKLVTTKILTFLYIVRERILQGKSCSHCRIAILSVAGLYRIRARSHLDGRFLDTLIRRGKARRLNTPQNCFANRLAVNGMVSYSKLIQTKENAPF